MGVNKRPSPEDIQKASKMELCLYYTDLNGFAPVADNKTTRESLQHDVLEFLESNGDRFFRNEDTRWLKKELGYLDTAYDSSRRSLVENLRKKLGFNYSSHLSAMDVSMWYHFSDFFLPIKLLTSTFLL